ncbi:hypothetical protein N7481_011315 [Penicillium waksmanii]|uniref:uncharacterized protein n=1 Tax=Penicillium waksmanii TaxID=69791 RepID=UPI002547ADED|nr:uncharacterized protein N7481_011315 [Penicillium waksmanii]KAJ5974105.1 hypothetical protein N7481_011315 [Penicillium waksmanii]
MPSSCFHQPGYKGAERLNVPSFCFLIEHESGQKILFDLGIRKNWQDLPPVVLEMFKKHDFSFKTKEDTSTTLERNGIDVSSGAISTVIWSHHHFDHVGDLSKFPSNTKLVVGDNFKKHYFPGYPDDTKSALCHHDFGKREIQELVFLPGCMKIGRFAAFDYFGDGSFYLLDTPGHTLSHISALARTDAFPPSFVLLTGDVCHHAGEIRPNERLPLPESIEPSPIPEISYPVCPGHLFRSIHPHQSRTIPFYSLAETFNDDSKVAASSITGVQELDCETKILTLITHDSSLLGEIPFFPKSLEGWADTDMKKHLKWKFLADFRQGL